MAERSSLKPAPASVAALIPQGLQAGKPPLPLGRPFTLVGSRNRAHLHLLSSTISRNHACIITTDNGLYVRDLASRTGVIVNGRKIKEVDLRDGDVVGIGSFKFKFADPAGPVRFPITPKAEPAMLEIDGTTLTPLDSRTLLIGRRPTCDVPLVEESVSNSHAIIFESNGQRFIRDLGSRTGTLVNGKPTHHQLLEFGDRIQIGDTKFRYIAAEAQEQPESVAVEAPADEHEYDLEPIGLHFAEPNGEHASSNGEAHRQDELIPMAEEAEAPIPLADETVHEEQPHEQPLPLVTTEAEHGIEDAGEAGAPDATPEQSFTAPIEVAGHVEDLGLDFVSEEPAEEPVEDYWPQAGVTPREPEAELEAPVETAEEQVPVSAEAGPAEPVQHQPIEEPPAASEEVHWQESTDDHFVIPFEPTDQPAVVEAPAEHPYAAPQGPLPSSELTGHWSDVVEPPATEDLPPIEFAPALPTAEAPAEEPLPTPAEEPPPAVSSEELSASEPTPIVTEVPVPEGNVVDVPAAEPIAAIEAPESGAQPKRGRGRAAGKKAAGRKRGSKKSRSEEQPTVASWDEATTETVQPTADTAPAAEAQEFTARATPEAVLTADLTDVVETTEPTPESAQSLQAMVPASETTEPGMVDQPVEPAVADSALTDTAFGRAVQEFVGAEAGPLVEATREPETTETRVDEQIAPPEQEPVETSDETNADPLADIPELTAAFAEEPGSELEPAPEPQATDLDLELAAIDESAPALDNPPATEPQEIPQIDFVSTETAAPSVDEPAITTESHGPGLTEPAPIPAPVPAPPPAAVDPFFGMSRDLGSFIGGMPLPLATDAANKSAAAVPPPNPVRSAGATEFTAPVDLPEPSIRSSGSVESAADDATITFSNEPDDLPPLDESLLADPEPLELFDDTGEKLDALPEIGPIADLGSVLGESPVKPAGKPHAAPPPHAGAGRHTARPTPPPPPKTKPTTPPRPAGLRSLTGQPASPAAAAPFAPQPAQPHGLQGNVTPQRPIRPTDVFSQTAFPGARDAFGAAPIEIPEIPPMARRPAGPSGPGAAQPAEQGRPRRAAIPPNRQPGGGRPSAPTPAPVAAAAGPIAPVAPPPPIAPAAPSKRPWYRRFGVLLSLMIVAIIIVIVLVLLLPQRHLLQGTLQFKGLDKLDALSRRPVIADIRKSLDDPQIRAIAAANLASQGIAPGFVQDPVALDQLSMPQNSPFDEARGALVLTRSTTDDTGDRARMKAILAALYAESGKNNDLAASARQKFDRAQATLNDLESQNAALDTRLSKLSDQIRSTAGAMAELILQNPSAGLLQLQQQDAQFHQDLNSAADLVSRRRDALQQAQAAAAKPDPARTAQIQQIRQAISDLTTRLQAVRLAQSGKADQAAKNFETALGSFDSQLSAIPDNQPDTKLAAFVAQARDLSDQIHQLDTRLTARQQEDRDAVAQLRRQLADRREAHLRQVWSADDGLKQLIEERNAQAHRFSAAQDSGYSDEATRIKGVLDDLDQKIDARRNALATGGQYADDLQQKLQQTIDRMEQSRQQDEQKMTEKLSRLEAAFPAADAVSAASRPVLVKLTSAASALGLARRTYATAAALSSADADTQAHQLQARLADQQARLDALSGAQPTDAPQAALKAARRDLDAAHEQAATASKAYIANHNLLTAVRDLAEGKARSTELADALKAARDEVEQRKADAARFPVIQQPDDNSVAVIYGKDQRLPYLITGILLTGVFFGIPMWMSLREPRIAHPHAAVAEGYDVLGHPAEAYGNLSDFDPDEHPAAV